MADAARTIEARTPYSMIYKIDGGATLGTFDPAADASAPTDGTHPGKGAGPLATTLLRLKAASAMASLNLDGTRGLRVRTRHVTGVNIGQTFPPTAINVQWTATGMTASVPAASQLILEIRLAQSNER